MVAFSGFRGALSTTVALLVIAAGMLVLASGCLGRLEDDSSSRAALPPSLALAEGRRGVVVFGAGWCKPCRKEIEDLNKARDSFGSSLEVVGVLVEGETKGARPTKDALRSFLSPRGMAPRYPVRFDSGWEAFDALNPPQGRALPLFVLVDEGGRVVRLLQSSLSYENELRPLLASFASGSALPPSSGDASRDSGVGTGAGSGAPGRAPSTPTPGAITTPVAGSLPAGVRRVSVEQWLRLERAADSASERPQRVRDAWTRGLGEFGFAAEDMPFAQGRASLVRSVAGGPEILASVEWTSSTNCVLTVTLATDGSYLGSRGICR